MRVTIVEKMATVNSLFWTALQRTSSKPAETALPNKISDLIHKSWDGNNERGQFRNFMAELLLWMQVATALCQILAQSDHEWTTDDGPANPKADRFRSMALDRQEV